MILIRFDLIWRFNWSKVDHNGPAAELPVELTAELEGAYGEVRRKLFSGAR